MFSRITKRQLGIAAFLLVAVCTHAAAGSRPNSKPTKPAPKVHLDKAYFAGKLVKFHPLPVRGAHNAVVGPWNLGQRVYPKPNDRRPNLYFVSPGTQHRAEGQPEFDHNEVVSAVPNEESFFDVFWVVVLDPSVSQDFTSEQQIILATQETFTPGEEFDFEQIPSVGFLREILKVRDVDGLEKFRRPDGELPRVAIVRAGFSMKALAEEIGETTESPTEPVKPEQTTVKKISD